MLGLEAVTGDLDNFGFEDYLNGKEPIINQQSDTANSNSYSFEKIWFVLLNFNN